MDPIVQNHQNEVQDNHGIRVVAVVADAKLREINQTCARLFLTHLCKCTNVIKIIHKHKCYGPFFDSSKMPSLIEKSG